MLDSLFYTISEASALTDQNKETLKKRCQSGKISGAKKIANIWLIPKNYVDDKPNVKAGVYIDGANMVHGCRTIDWTLDYSKVADFIKRRYNPSIISYYDSLGYEKDKSGELIEIDKNKYKPNSAQIKFFQFLEGIGFRVTRKPLKFIGGDITKPKNNMDTYITLDVFKEMSRWDTLILFSGDSDFDRLIEEVTPLGKHVHIFSFSKLLSYELKMRSFASPLVSYTEINDLKTILERKEDN